MKDTYYEIRKIDGDVKKDSEWFLHEPDGDEYEYNPTSLK